MCGIAGIVAFAGDRVEADDIESMTSQVRHRGPDAIGHQVDDGWALGHARLAVIDVEGGAQPMSTADGRLSITYNGELYNFRELYTELEGAGHRFRTRSDTEVVLEAWRAWGPECVRRFRGMFAFGIVDRDRRQVFIARDHLGIKPLVYFHEPAEFSFASALAALRTRPTCPTSISLEALDHYLALSYIPAPLTVFRGVHKLPPAHHLTVDLDSGVTEGPRRYWSLEFDPIHGRDEDDWASELEDVLRESVRAHLVSDVPVGAFLSGGVDSSLIVSMMAQEAADPVRTYSIGFDEPEYDESSFAREAATRWGTRHRERVVRPDALAILPDLVRHYGEPFGDWSAVPTFHLSALAREEVPVVLSGDGGDEGFGGYDRYVHWLEKAGPKGTRPGTWAARLLRQSGTPGATSGFDAFAMMVLRPPARRSLWREELLPSLSLSSALMDREDLESRRSHPLSRAQGLDLRTYLPGAILTKVDVASMFHGLEVRTPLVDRRVLEFAATVPPEFHIRSHRDGRWETKPLLRRILRRYFDDRFVDRPKRGFIPPVAEWFSAGSPTRAMVEDRLTGPEARLGEYFRSKAVQKLLTDVARGGAAEPVWLLLFLETWLDHSAGGGRIR